MAARALWRGPWRRRGRRSVGDGTGRETVGKQVTDEVSWTLIQGVSCLEVPVGRGLGRNQPGDPDMKVLETICLNAFFLERDAT